jgi:hypothetical protein
VSRRVALLSLLLATGCVTSRSAECQAHGGTTWLEARTKHFRIVSSISAGETADVARSMEMVLEGYRQFINDKVEFESVDVVLLGEGQLESLGIKGFAGRANTWKGRLVMQWPDAWHTERNKFPSTPAHEVAHLVVAQAFPSVPYWLDEGLASYLDTAQFKGEHEIKFGMGSYRLTDFRELPAVPLVEMWSWTPVITDEKEMRRRYATAWAWTHYLFNHERAAFDAALADFAARKPGRPSFERAFPNFETEQLPRALEYAKGGKSGKYTAYTLTVEEPAPAVITELPAWRAHVARDWVWEIAVDHLKAEEIRKNRELEAMQFLVLAPPEAGEEAAAFLAEKLLPQDRALAKFGKHPAVRAQQAMAKAVESDGVAQELEAVRPQLPTRLDVAVRLATERAGGPRNGPALEALVARLSRANFDQTWRALAVALLSGECKVARTLHDRVEQLVREVPGRDASYLLESVEVLCPESLEPPAGTGCEEQPARAAMVALVQNSERLSAAVTLSQWLNAKKRVSALALQVEVGADGALHANNVGGSEGSPIVRRSVSRVVSMARVRPPCAGAETTANVPVTFRD